MGSAASWCTKSGASPTLDASSEFFEFTSFSVVKRRIVENTGGIRGTRDHPKERLRTGIYEVGGSITFHPSPADLDIWLPRILGGSESSDTFSPTNTLETNGIFSIGTDYVRGGWQYRDCRVNKATFKSKAGRGSLLELTLDIVGKTQASLTYPATTFGTSAGYKPFVFSDAVFTFVSSARTTMDVEITIDNMITPRFSNSETATDLMASDRIITVKTTHPYTSTEADLYDGAIPGSSGTIVFTNADSTGLVLTFTFANLTQEDTPTPSITSKAEIPLVCTHRAYSSGSTASLVITNDSAP